VEHDSCRCLNPENSRNHGFISAGNDKADSPNLRFHLHFGGVNMWSFTPQLDWTDAQSLSVPRRGIAPGAARL
jgi:hypothetical protein